MAHGDTAFLFDLDGTLVDSVYQHVLAWKEALDKEGVDVSIWRIHRKIGMSGSLFANMLLLDTDLEITEERLQRLRQCHAEAFNRQHAQGSARPLPGTRELLTYLCRTGDSVRNRHQRPHADGRTEPRCAGGGPLKNTGGDTRRSTSCQARSRSVSSRGVTAGDRHSSGADRGRQRVGHAGGAADPWALGIGLLCGGYGKAELQESGAFRVYEDRADPLRHIDEVAARE